MTSVLLVPDLPLERWPSMDRYASRLALHLKRLATDLEIALAGEIGGLTVEQPRGKTVVTVHDLLPVMVVQRGGATLRDSLRNRLLARVLRGLRQADAWIVSTEWLRGELAAWLGHSDRIHVIPYGVDDAFFDPPPASREETRARLGIPLTAHVVLHVGSVAPRKNIPAVIAAVHGLRRSGMNAWLLQAGGRFTEEQRKDLVTYGLERYSRQMVEAAEADLRAAYRAADVLLFPSHYEGFGLPVLEAMASGLPAVTSGAGGLAEVAGDAAVVVGGGETEPYVTALRRIAGNPLWREQLVARGRERARRFRWVEAARRTAEVYRSLARR